MGLFATSLVAIANTSQLLSQELMVSGLTQAPSLPVERPAIAPSFAF
jgi:hypothetical protein